MVNSCNHKDLPEARNFFSLLEGLVVFINASVARHRTFLEKQKDILRSSKLDSDSTSTVLLRPDAADDENEGEGSDSDDDAEGPSGSQPSSSQLSNKTKERPVIPGRGISDTRWIGRASTLNRFGKPHVITAALETVNEVIESTSTDAKARAVALGFKNTLQSVTFLTLLVAFKPLLYAVNGVSEYLQQKNIDIGSAMNQVAALKKEIQALRSDEHWNTVLKETSDVAAVVGVNLEDEVEKTEATQRRRKVSKKIDENPDTEAELTLMEKI